MGSKAAQHIAINIVMKKNWYTNYQEHHYIDNNNTCKGRRRTVRKEIINVLSQGHAKEFVYVSST